MWKITTNASQTKLFFPTIRERIAIKTLIHNYLITQYLSGHGDFRVYLKRFKLRLSDVCFCGRSQETSLHVIFQCDLDCEQRHQLINAIHRSGHSLPLKPKNLISEKNIYLQFIDIIKNVKILTKNYL